MQPFNLIQSCRRVSLIMAAAATLTAAHSHAAFTAELEAQSFGSTNWVTGHIGGWAELDLIPARIRLAGGPATNRTLTINFPQAGIQNLYSFTPSANVEIISGPTLSAPISGKWTYTFAVNLLDNQPGAVEFKMRLSAGAHRFTGSSLQVDGTPGFSKLFVFKPSAKPGAPDLGLRKSGPALANPGAILAYSVAYSNRVQASTATGVQLIDTLPAVVTLLDCDGGCEAVGNIITWDLGDIPRGATGMFTYRVLVSDALTTGFTLENNVVIEEAEDDANYADNSASVTTVITGNCVPPSVVAQPADAAHCAGESATFSILANGSHPMSYQWRKDGTAMAGATNATLTLPALTLADAGTYDVVLSNLCGAATSTAASLMVGGGALVTSQPVSDVWCAGDTASFYVEATGDELTYQWRKDGVDLAGATNSWIEMAGVTADDAGVYDVVIGSFCGETVSAPARLTLRTPVRIQESPADVTICAGSSTLLSVAATGDEPLAYQWRKDGSEIPGANSSTLNVSDAGRFDVLVTGACNSAATSAVAVVTVHTPPEISQGPVSATLCVGAPVTFEVNATGTGPLTYQWRKNGADIAAATSASFALTAVTADDAGSYDVVVTGVCGSPAIAAPAILEISPAATALGESYATDEDGTLVVGAPGVLANDSGLRAALVTGASHGTVQLAADGSFTYMPAGHFHGADHFTYRAVNDCGSSEPVTVTITVTSVPDAPMAAADAYQIEEDDVLEVGAPGVLANDADLEGRPLTAELVAPPANGSLTLNSDGSFTYVPGDNFSGTDHFTYRAAAGGQLSAPVTVTIQVLEILGAGDVDLFVKTAKGKLNWTAPDRDVFAVKGQVNPRGIKNNLAGTTVEIRLNNETIFAPVTLDAAGKYSGASGGVAVKVTLRGANGAYSVRLAGANLREALGLENVTGQGLTNLKVQLRIFDADLGVPVTTAQLETPFTTVAGKTSALKFSFRKNRTLSGVFNANKTVAATGKDGLQLVATRGAATGEGGVAVVPNGDIEVFVGTDEFTIPLAQLTASGTDYSYTGAKGAGVVRFGLRNSLRSFLLAAAGDLGLPGLGNGILAQDLPIMIRVPTADGLVTFESLVELKRSSDASPKWKR
jgi:hypothetical protein